MNSQKKSDIDRVLMFAMFCSILIFNTPLMANPPTCLKLSDMEKPNEWDGPFLAETTKGTNGGKALAFNFGKGGSGEWRSRTFADRKIDLDSYDLLKFDYRTENCGGYFSVRFRQFPYLGGFLAMGHHIDPVFKPTEWQTMTFNLHEPENAWNQSYNRMDRQMTLSFGNVVAEPGKKGLVFVDNIRLIRRQFSVDCDIDDLYLDFGKRQDLPDGTSIYHYPLSIRNRTDKKLTIKMRLDTSKLKRFSAKSEKSEWTLPPKGTVQAMVVVTVPAAAKKNAPIAYGEETLANFMVAGDPDSEHTITLLAAVPFKTKRHPYLFATNEQIQNARKRIKQWGWAQTAAGEYFKRAEFAMNIPAGLPKYEPRPEQPGDKICPTCKDKGKVRPIVIDNPYRNECQYRYQCETCGKMLSSKLWKGKSDYYLYREDGYWWKPGSEEHSKGHAISFSREGNVLDLAVAWQLDGKKEYLQKVAETIKEYNNVLPTYPFTNMGAVAFSCFHGKGGVRVGNYFNQTVWLHHMTSALDLIWDSGALSEKEKQEFLKQLTEILYQRLRIWSPGYSNHRTTSAGLGVALLTDNAPLLSYVLNDPYSGVGAFFKDTMYPDGFVDMAAQYMDPVMLSWMPIFNTLRNVGVDLPKQYPGLRRFGVSIQEWLDPDGLSPDLGDSCSSRSLSCQDWFEYCYAWTDNPQTIIPVQRRFYDFWSHYRHLIKWENIKRDKGTLFWGVENIPRGNPEPPRGSYNFPDYGLLIFNQGEGDKRLWAAMPHGKPMGHGHHDNMHLEWWALGQKMTLKQGSRGRSHAVHENTLLVDQKDQNKIPCQLSNFVDKGPVQGAVITSKSMYPGTTLTRTIMLYDGALFLLDLFDSDQTRIYDSAYMNVGTAHCELPFKPLDAPLADELNQDGKPVGYASLLEPEEAPAPPITSITWDNFGTAKNGQVRETQFALDSPGTMLRVMTPLVKQHRQWETLTDDIKAAGYKILPQERQLLAGNAYVELLAPKFIRRFKAKQAGLLTILEPYQGDSPRFKNVERLQLTLDGKPTKKGIALRFDDENGVEHQIIMCPEKGIKKAGGWTTKTAFTAGPNGPLVVE